MGLMFCFEELICLFICYFVLRGRGRPIVMCPGTVVWSGGKLVLRRKSLWCKRHTTV
jgi:hypothetical protein